MVDDETLARFERMHMGWLTHEGELFPCRIFGHVEKLGEFPIFREAFSRFKDACADNRAWMEESLSSLAPDAHPEMHRFEGMDDEAKAEFMRTVYTTGWIRLGHSSQQVPVPAARRFDRRPRDAQFQNRWRWYVEAEGLTDAVRAQAAVLKDLADRLGCDLVAREMRYQVVNYGTVARPNEHEVLVPEASEESPAPRGFR